MINGYIDAINRIVIQPFASLRPFLHRAAAMICRILCSSVHHHPTAISWLQTRAFVVSNDGRGNRNGYSTDFPGRSSHLQSSRCSCRSHEDLPYVRFHLFLVQSLFFYGSCVSSHGSRCFFLFQYHWESWVSVNFKTFRSFLHDHDRQLASLCKSNMLILKFHVVQAVFGYPERNTK